MCVLLANRQAHLNKVQYMTSNPFTFVDTSASPNQCSWQVETTHYFLVSYQRNMFHSWTLFAVSQLSRLFLDLEIPHWLRLVPADMYNHEKTTSENKWLLGHDILLGHIDNRDTIFICVHSCSGNKVGRCSLVRIMSIEVSRILKVHI